MLRLLAAGADPRRVYFVEETHRMGTVLPFDPARDMGALAMQMDTMDGVSLLILDPIAQAIADDSHKAWEVPRGLQPVIDLATRQNTAVIGISHLSKGSAIGNALYENKWLEVTYKNASGYEASYKIMPLGLVQQGPRMYLACRFEGYDNNRSLALHRMISAKASTLTFDRPSDFDLQQLNDDLVFSEEAPKTIRLSFRIDKNNGLHIVECPLSADQQVVVLEDGYEITATVVDTDVLDRWLTGFGDGVSEITKRPM